MVAQFYNFYFKSRRSRLKSARNFHATQLGKNPTSVYLYPVPCNIVIIMCLMKYCDIYVSDLNFAWHIFYEMVRIIMVDIMMTYGPSCSVDGSVKKVIDNRCIVFIVVADTSHCCNIYKIEMYVSIMKASGKNRTCCLFYCWCFTFWCIT